MSQNTTATLRQSFQRRAFLIGGVQGGVGLLLAARMGYLAVAENEKYKMLAESNRGRWSAFQAAGWGALGALIGLVEGLTADDQLVYRAPDAR